jgi:glycosyltransferase involved in cell wall biosynthesis
LLKWLRRTNAGTAGAGRRVLLTVSGVVPDDLDEQVAAGVRPRADYRALCDTFGAELLDVARARRESGRIGRVLECMGGAGLLLAWACFRRRRQFDVVFTDGEQVGMPFAALCRVLGTRGSRHVMVVHILSVPKKELVFRIFRLRTLIDRFVVYCTAQQQYLLDHLAVEPRRVVLTPFMVDAGFFDPAAVPAHRRRMICAAGLERRDYPTLMEAVADLDVEVVIAAASPWSKWTDSSSLVTAPPNVEIRRLGFVDLRQLYAEAQVVVMPLDDVDFQAGITTILEAMAMERAVVCTRTRGQTDTLIDGSTGVYVPLGDVRGLRDRIRELLDRPAEADRMGRDARRWVIEHASLDVYAQRLGRELEALLVEQQAVRDNGDRRARPGHPPAKSELVQTR